MGGRWLKEDTYHSPFEEVYHIVSTCPVGRLIPVELRMDGTGNRPLCSACKGREDGRRDSPV